MNEGRIYIGTEQGNIYCLQMSDGATLWKRIRRGFRFHTAVADGFIYTAAGKRLRYCLRQENGEWLEVQAEGGLSRNYKERSGFGPAPSSSRSCVYRFKQRLMLLSATDKGEVVWQQLMRAQSGERRRGRWPRRIGDNRMEYMLSADDGRRLWELRIGENINATPAILEGAYTSGPSMESSIASVMKVLSHLR